MTEIHDAPNPARRQIDSEGGPESGTGHPGAEIRNSGVRGGTIRESASRIQERQRQNVA